MTTQMSPAVYQQKRDELAKLLDYCVDTIDGLAKEHEELQRPDIARHCEALKRIRTKVYEDQFKIALIAKFQGGKSTTFNALAGGLPLSPMGDGAIKTSACICRAWNSTDAAQRGATIVWRTDEELLLTVMDLLRDQLIKLDSDRFNGKDANVMAKEINLANCADRELLDKAVKAEVAEYLTNKSGYTSGTCAVSGGKIHVFGSDKVNLLLIAVIISRYYGDQEIEQLKQQSFTSDTAGALLRFPADFTINTDAFFKEEEKKEVFQPRELAFAFIKDVQMRLESENLAHLGIGITDCPGLSASAYDSRIALDVIGESDAVWYLLDGCSIGASELDEIKKAHASAFGKIFFTVNLKSGVNAARMHIVEKIIPHQKEQLRQQGVEVTLNPYHAFLAYLAMAGLALKEGNAAETTKNDLTQKARDMGISADTPANAWAMLVEEMLHRLKVPAKQQFVEMKKKLSPEGIALVRKASELDAILVQIEGYVIEHKAACILVDGGVMRAVQAVEDGIEKPLKALEEDAEKNVDDCKEKYDVMEAELKRFHKESQANLLGLDSKDPDRALAEDVIEEVILKAIPDAAASAAPKVTDKFSLWAKLKNVFQAEKQQKEIEAIVTAAIQTAIDPLVRGWQEELKAGQNPHFNHFLHQVDNCRKQLNKNWKQELQTIPWLQAIPDPTASFDGEKSRISLISPSDLNGQLSEQFFGGYLLSLGGASLGAFGVFLILDHMGGCGVFSIAGGAIMLLWKMFCLNKAAYDTKVKNAIENNLGKAVREKRNDIIAKIAREMAKFREPYIKLFTDGFKLQLEELERQRKDAETVHQGSEDGRQHLTMVCNHIRTEHITPLREKLEAYRDKVVPLLPAFSKPVRASKPSG